MDICSQTGALPKPDLAVSKQLAAIPLGEPREFSNVAEDDSAVRGSD